MRIVGLRAPHLNERRLAEAAEADEVGALAGLTEAEQRHLAACNRCSRLFDGHRRAVRVLAFPWQRVDVPPAPLPVWRRGAVVRWAQLAAVVAIAVALTAVLLNWRQGGTPVGPASTPSPTGAATASPTGLSTASPKLSSPLPTETKWPAGFPNSTPSSATTLLDIPAALRMNVPLSPGAQVDTGVLVADSDWLVMGIYYPYPSTIEALYAANLHTGALRKILDSIPQDVSVAGSQVGWVDETCQASMPSPLPTEQAHIPPLINCGSWRVLLTDLDTGVSRVVAQGSNPPVVNDLLSEGGDPPHPVVPAVALGDGELAYTTGDLTHGIKLNLLTLSSGAMRTIALAAPIAEMKWAGSDLAWVEDSDLQPAGSLGGSHYPWYSGSHLMLLSQGASAARRIADGASFLDADTGEIIWNTGGCETGSASAPGWQPADTHYDYACSAFVSEGWLGWTVQYPNANFLILGPSASEPVGILDGVALTGGWLVLGPQPAYQRWTTLIPTKLEVVRVSDLP
ncbi:MAG TPA: hypothetical protein VIK06_01215 [Candidatus Limnocylindrales bacterium]